MNTPLTPPRGVDVPPLRSQLEVARVGSNARWGAVLAGALMAIATWLVLYLFGIGVGLTAIDPSDSNPLRGVGVGTGVWSAIAPIIALFVGGLVASRLAPTPNALNRALHGGLVWAVSAIVMVIMLYTVLTNVVGGLATTGAKVAGSATTAVTSSLSSLDSDSLEALGIDGEQVLAPINERLRTAGKPAVTTTQLRAAAKDAVSQAIQTGSFDRAAMTRALARNTPLSQRDAEEIATAVEDRWTAIKARLDELADRARVASLEAAEATGKAVMAASIAFLLALAASIGGALITGRHDRRRDGDRVIA
jgi:hypothetical protein